MMEIVQERGEKWFAFLTRLWTSYSDLSWYADSLSGLGNVAWMDQ